MAHNTFHQQTYMEREEIDLLFKSLAQARGKTCLSGDSVFRNLKAFIEKYRTFKPLELYEPRSALWAYQNRIFISILPLSPLNTRLQPVNSPYVKV